MQKQLVIQFARFGDLIQTKRLILTLLEKGSVHLCLDQSLAEFAKTIYPEVTIHSLAIHGTPKPESIAANRHVFDILVKENFDKVYNLNHSNLNLALVRLFEPSMVNGYAMHGNQVVRSSWVKLAFRLARQRKVATLNVMDYWANFANNPISPNCVNPIATSRGRGIGIVLAGREQRRSIPPQILSNHVHTFFEIFNNAPIFIFGSKGQEGLAKQLMREFSGSMLAKTQNLTGKTSLADLTLALADLDILLSPDTGLMHLAAHLGTPVLAFFLSSAWCFETGPYGLGHYVAQADMPCLPCLESANCIDSTKTPCLEPFANPIFKAMLIEQFSNIKSLGQISRNLSGLMFLKSGLDALGSNWQLIKGEDSKLAERTMLRAILTEYVGAGKIESIVDPIFAGRLYQEADWLLPKT